MSSGGIMATRILLVDHDKVRSDNVRAILTSKGYQVVDEADREKVFSLLTSGRFDLILLDITLPDRSGFRVLEFLKKNHLPSKVMVLTGTTGLPEVLSSAIATPGSQDYITKPYSPDDLLKSIEHVLSERSHENLKIQIIKAGDFIKSTPTGDLDMKASKEGLAQIAATGTDLHEYTILIDLRDIKSRLSTSDIYDLASDLVRYGETFRRKTAVLVRADEDIGQAAFFESVAQNRGFKVRTFTIFEEAIIWLSTIPPHPEDQ
jgi:DNA-binding response OmpR family regulator